MSATTSRSSRPRCSISGLSATALALALLAGCAEPEETPGARRLAAGRRAHGFAVSPDLSRAAWIEGEWPDRTRLAVQELPDGRVSRSRFGGYSLVEAAFDAEGRLKALARRVGGLAHPRNPPQGAVVLSVGPGGSLLAVEAAQGRILGRRAAGAARGPIESSLSADGALYMLARSSGVPAGKAGPRAITKIDARTGRTLWTASWAPRESELLAVRPGDKLYVAVRDPDAPSLWELEDRPESVAFAGAAAAAPGAARAKGLRLLGLYLARFAPLFLLGLVFFFLRR